MSFCFICYAYGTKKSSDGDQSHEELDLEAANSLLICGLVGTVVRRRAHHPRVVCSKPTLAVFEDSILGQGVNTNCASLHPGV